MRFTIWAALLAAALWPRAASAEWLEASSDHFVIYADDSERDIQRFSEQLERFHAGMALLTHNSVPKPSPSNRVTVYVVRNDAAVRDLYGGDSRFVSGFYVPRAGGSLAIVPRVEARAGSELDFSMVVLLHEYAHHFLISSSSMAMPRWLSEGGAEFFASASFERDGTLGMGRPAQHRGWELFNAADVSVAELLDPERYEKRQKRDYDAFYGKSWLLYHFLTFDKEREGQLARYVRLLAEGKSMPDAAVEAFGDLRELEKAVDRYLRKPRLIALRLGPELLQTGPIAVRRLSAGEAAIMPVRIRSRVGVDEDLARSLVGKARAIAARFPGDAGVLSALAEAEYDTGNDDEAIAAADAAIAIDPARVNAYVQKGYALFRQAQDAAPKDAEAAYKRARAPFLALNKLENDHPLPLVYYYRSFAEQGGRPPELAISGLVRASDLAPFDLGLRMNVATALIQAGRQPEARFALEPVAFNPHGGEMAQAARNLLDRLTAEPGWKGEGMGAVVAASGGAGTEEGTR